MHIGILETDTLEPGIQKKYGSYAEMFQRLFLSVNDQLTFKIFPVIVGSYPDNIDDCDAYLITGSKYSAYDSEPWIKQLCDFIVALHKQRRKLIGICFGHQIIAQALGGKTQKSNKGWAVGNSISKIEKAKPWMANETKQFTLLVSHRDQVTRLPVHAELVATNAFCPNACFQIENHILTFQGHPEFSVDYLNYLLNKRQDIIGEEKYKKAIDSLQYDQDNQLVARWIINFIHQ